MKKRIILSSILAIAMCVSVAVGATFALLTSDSENLITVTAAKVSVVAEASNIKTYSMGVEQTDGNFANGGSAKIDNKNGTISLSRLSSGDKAAFDINVTNKSDIKVNYRVSVKTSSVASSDMVGSPTDALMSALVIKTQVDGEAEKTYDGWTYFSNWDTLEASTSGTVVRKTHVSIELPEDPEGKLDPAIAGAKAVIKYQVEAVQGNANVTDDPDDEYSIYNIFDLRAFAAKVNGGETFEGKTVKIFGGSFMNEYTINPIGDATHPFKGAFIGVPKGTARQVNISKLIIESSEAYGHGLFYRLGDGAVVKNIALNGITVKSTSDQIDEVNKKFSLSGNICGALAGYTSGNVTIENVSVQGDSKIYGYGKVGGLIGMNEGGSALKLINVNVWGVYIRGSYNLGGLVGLSLDGAPTVDAATKVSKEYTIDRMFVCDKYLNSFVDIDGTIAMADGTTKAVKGTFLKKTEGGICKLFAVKSNLYTVKGSEYDGKQITVSSGEEYFIGDSAIVENAGIFDGVLNSNAYKIA